MRQVQHELRIRTKAAGLIDITGQVVAWLDGSGLRTGLLTLFLRHTSASLLIQENADPDVLADLQTFLERLVPERTELYRHTTEGPDDMPAHIRAALTQVQLSVPIAGGSLALGTWQAIYLFEHRRAPQDRRVVLHAFGD